MRKGLLLVNLGTPQAPETGAVRRYLREFLDDPRVVDLHPVARWLLLHLFILPFRPARSAAAYRSIWTPEGSPLLVHGRALAEAVARRLAGEYEVELAMRYGQPSLPEAVERLRARKVRHFTLLPLYPQEAPSSYGSTLARVYEVLAGQWDVPLVRVVPPFHDHPAFLDVFAAVAQPVLEQARADHVLFSFHGVSERHVRKSDPTHGRHCLASTSCCDVVNEASRHCYRAQCYATARALSSRLSLEPGNWSVSFQSRLGRTPWVHPYTDLVLPELARRGVKRLAVVCPSFVADCLETLEEVAIRAREQFVNVCGGESLTLVPSLNAHPVWVEAVVRMVREEEGGSVRRAAGAPSGATPQAS